FDALLDAGLVVWAQATLWSSFSRPLGRVLAAVGVFAAYCGMWALVRVDVLIPTSAAIAIACALLAAGFVVGLRAVERARWAAAAGTVRTKTRRSPRSHSSPLGALLWVDRHVRGRR